MTFNKKFIIVIGLILFISSIFTNFHIHYKENEQSNDNQAASWRGCAGTDGEA